MTGVCLYLRKNNTLCFRWKEQQLTTETEKTIATSYTAHGKAEIIGSSYLPV